MRKEVERCRIAVEKAMEGNTVAMVSSGDSGIYGMAGVVMEVAEEMNADVEVIPVAELPRKCGSSGTRSTAYARFFNNKSERFNDTT